MVTANDDPALFDRQSLISGWDQAKLASACVFIGGRTIAGAYLAWALSAMGVGSIILAGAPFRAQRFLAWLSGDPRPYPGVNLLEYPSDIESVWRLTWMVSSGKVDVVCSATESAFEAAILEVVAKDLKVPYCAGTVADGGWCGSTRPTELASHEELLRPWLGITALAVAAQLADRVRQTINPLPDDVEQEDGHLGMDVPLAGRPVAGPVAIVGLGAIGTFVGLELSRQYGLFLVDHDRIELSNMNRQTLFSADDARAQLHKVTASKKSIRRIVPRATVRKRAQKITSSDSKILRQQRPGVLISTVDNAKARIMLQEYGAAHGIPVVQGSTGVFAADAYVQDAHGTSLDEQLHGALTTAVDREARTPRERRPGGCAGDPSFCVPGMWAGAMVCRRLVQVSEGYRGLPAHHWRSGSLPMEAGTARRDGQGVA